MGEPNGGWKPWLMSKLSLLHIWAVSLAMPTPNEPNKDEWVREMERSIGEPDEDIFLVGHSLGSPAILRYLEKLPENSKIGGVVLVSSPSEILHSEKPESKLRKIDNFLDKPFDFEHIKKVCNNFVVIHGDNDDRVPFKHGEKIAASLNCNLISVAGGGHLNEFYNIYELPEALEVLTEMI